MVNKQIKKTEKVSKMLGSQIASNIRLTKEYDDYEIKINERADRELRRIQNGGR